jgi:hypothetical protein
MRNTIVWETQETQRRLLYRRHLAYTRQQAHKGHPPYQARLEPRIAEVYARTTTPTAATTTNTATETATISTIAATVLLATATRV